MNAFEFVVLSALRAVQLQRGCTPRVEQSPKLAVTAQLEVAGRKVLAVAAAPEPVSLPQTTEDMPLQLNDAPAR